MMTAMVLRSPGGLLEAVRMPIPAPSEHEVLLRVRACGVCRTDLHIADGDMPPHRQPLVLGHEIVGEVVARGSHADQFDSGDRVGVPWLGGTCGHCPYCDRRRENLCDEPAFAGYDRDGGFAEYVTADPRYCFRIPESYDDLHAAPLLCAGLIGHRAYAMAGDAERIGLYGFGAAAHILAQIARFEGREIFALTRPGDTAAQAFARSLGAAWAGDAGQKPPAMLDAAILFAPVGALVPMALSAVRKGGTVVCAGIHMSEIPAFPYSLLWGERTLRSVANLTRADGEHFMRIAGKFPIRTSPVAFDLLEANRAMQALRDGSLTGAAVLVPGTTA